MGSCEPIISFFSTKVDKKYVSESNEEEVNKNGHLEKGDFVPILEEWKVGNDVIELALFNWFITWQVGKGKKKTQSDKKLYR